MKLVDEVVTKHYRTVSVYSLAAQIFKEVVRCLDQCWIVLHIQNRIEIDAVARLLLEIQDARV